MRVPRYTYRLRIAILARAGRAPILTTHSHHKAPHTVRAIVRGRKSEKVKRSQLHSQHKAPHTVRAIVRVENRRKLSDHSCIATTKHRMGGFFGAGLNSPGVNEGPPPAVL
jgi:hypothetical protein